MTESFDIEESGKRARRWAMSRAGEGVSSAEGRGKGRAVSVATFCLLAIEACIPQQYAVHVASPAYAAGTDQQSSGTVPVPSTKPEGDGAAINVDLFLRHAADAGISTCSGVYASLGKALTNGNPFMLLTQSAKENADIHSLQGVVGMNYRSQTGYAGPAAGLVFAAPVGTACEGQMVRVVPVPETCQATAALLPQGSTTLPPLNGIPVYSLPGGGQAMLVPASAGCVAISIIWSGG